MSSSCAPSPDLALSMASKMNQRQTNFKEQTLIPPTPTTIANMSRSLNQIWVGPQMQGIINWTAPNDIHWVPPPFFSEAGAPFFYRPLPPPPPIHFRWPRIYLSIYIVGGGGSTGKLISVSVRVCKHTLVVRWEWTSNGGPPGFHFPFPRIGVAVSLAPHPIPQPQLWHYVYTQRGCTQKLCVRASKKDTKRDQHWSNFNLLM